MDHADDRTATFLELFFDLVFVYAITQIVSYVVHEHEVSAYGGAALVFAVVWWAWSQFTWVANAIDMDNRWNRVGILAATATAFFMARGVPDALDAEGAPWFTVSYVATMAIGLSLYWFGLRADRDHQRALLTYFPIVVPGTLLVGAAGFVDETARPFVYLAALVVLAMSGVAAERGAIFRIAPGHFAERHGLIVIIALGETLIAVGVASQALPRTGLVITAIVLGVTGSLALWWAYFDWFVETTEEWLRSRSQVKRGPFARDLYTFGHYPIVYGIVAFAVALEEAIAHPDEALAAVGRFGLATGFSLFLLATVAVHLRAGGVVLVERIVGSILMVVAVVLFPDLDAVVAVAIAVGLLVAVLAIERARHHAGALRLETSEA